MKKVNSLLKGRLKPSENSTKNKMSSLAQRSSAGNLTSFSGVFSIADLNKKEKLFLENLLEKYSFKDKKKCGIDKDLSSLIAITSEVKAINNQAALLHGERIKKVQTLLLKYADGAFTSWLKATYSNRQTPYNFLQYYNFWLSIPVPLRTQIESMPRQAIYSLSSRAGSLKKKKQLVIEYKGETKDELMVLIRKNFPLNENDQRKQDIVENLIKKLQQIDSILSQQKVQMTKQQKHRTSKLLEKISSLI